MEIMLLLLWSIPLMLGLVVLVRALKGTSVISDSESRLIFGKANYARLSVWMGIKFAILAVAFFMIGLFEGAVLLNFGMAWIALASLLTASGAILLLVLWVRSGPSERVHQPAFASRTSEKLSARGHFELSTLLETSKRENHSETT
jgi:hypothetical protein